MSHTITHMKVLGNWLSPTKLVLGWIQVPRLEASASIHCIISVSPPLNTFNNTLALSDLKVIPALHVSQYSLKSQNWKMSAFCTQWSMYDQVCSIDELHMMKGKHNREDESKKSRILVLSIPMACMLNDMLPGLRQYRGSVFSKELAESASFSTSLKKDVQQHAGRKSLKRG